VFSEQVLYSILKLVEKVTPRHEEAVVTATLKVLKTFSKQKDKQVIGCRVASGLADVGKRFKIGSVTFETVKRISRCAATNVNLKTAERDQNLPKALMQNFGHTDMGIYARVVEGGSLRAGDEIKTC